MKKKVVLLFFSIITFCCFAETYIIRDYIWNLEGKTDSVYLERRIDAKKDIEFSAKDDLQNYIDGLNTVCSNLRLFESLKTEMEISSSGNPECFDVIVKITAKESRSLLIVAYPKYSSTEGIEFKAKVKDTNFQGMTEPFEAEIAFIMQKKTYEKNYRPGAGGAFEYSMPFYFENASLTWDNDFEISYIKDDSLPEWDCTMGISLLVPFKKSGISFSAHQKAARDSLYEKYDDEIYFSENADLSFPIELYKNSRYGSFHYAPGTSLEWIWNKKGVDERTEDLDRQELMFYHKLSFGKIDWEGTFRRGFEFCLKHEAGWNFYNDKFVHGVIFDFTGHTHSKRIGVNFRSRNFLYKNKNIRIGDYLRGIADDQYFNNGKTGYDDFFICSTKAAVVLNLDVPIKLFEIDFGESSLKLFDCEVQFIPFVDVALTYNRYTERNFNPKDGFYCAGFELIVYPKKFKSMQARLSGGIDLSRTLFKDYADNSWKQDKISKYEITFGFDLYF